MKNKLVDILFITFIVISSLFATLVIYEELIK